MADFKKAWAITSVNEGGYVNDSDDKESDELFNFDDSVDTTHNN